MSSIATLLKMTPETNTSGTWKSQIGNARLSTHLSCSKGSLRRIRHDDQQRFMRPIWIKKNLLEQSSCVRGGFEQISIWRLQDASRKGDFSDVQRQRNESSSSFV